MTERGARHIDRGASHFAIGPSSLRLDGDRLHFDIDERAMPWLQRVRGRVSVQLQGLTRWRTALDPNERHHWQPIAPRARVETAFTQPGLRWSGTAYVDSNEGDEPVERAFSRWDWLRSSGSDDEGSVCVVYDPQPLQGAMAPIARRFAADGSSQLLAVGPRQALGASRWWRVDRQARALAPAGAGAPGAVRALEDTPFYARTLIRWPDTGDPAALAVHETLDVRRLTSPIVQCLLPFRMPRAA
jgi:carotenoid 1,2-hydratase